jgi:hypothetical protein
MAPISTIDHTEHAREPQERLRKLRELAHWYREFADRTGNPAIWEARLRTAEQLEQEANRFEEEWAGQPKTRPKPLTETQVQDLSID